MPGSPLPGALEVVEYYPNASDRAGSISKFHDSLKIVAKAPGFEGIVFDGYSKEEEGVSWRVVKWASYDVSFDFLSLCLHLSQRISVGLRNVGEVLPLTATLS